jgi:hypothetical protein
MVEIDILGSTLAKSRYTWMKTGPGIHFLPIGQDVALFLLPDPSAPGMFFQGRVDGTSANAPVVRLDSGSLSASQAKEALEGIADGSDWTYSNKGASWRRTPASEAQVRMLRRMRVDVPEKLKKGEASDALSVAKFSRPLARFAKYVTG